MSCLVILFVDGVHLAQRKLALFKLPLSIPGERGGEERKGGEERGGGGREREKGEGERRGEVTDIELKNFPILLLLFD